MKNQQMDIRLTSGPGSFLVFLTLALVLLCNIVSAQAGSPWKWKLVLKQAKVGDAMVMPTSLFINPDKGIYYVVDSGKNRLLSFDRKGELLRILNAGKALDIPFDMASTKDNELWVVEKGKNSLSFIDLKAKKVVPNTLHYADQLVYPDRLESAAGLLYVLDKATGNILQYDAKLNPGVRFSSDDCPWGFVDFKIHDNDLWALDQRRKTISLFTLDGQLKEKIQLGGNLKFPISLAIGPSGYVYVLDRHGRRVSVHDKKGSFKYSFLSRGITRGQVYKPSEIRFDPWGGLCVVDEGNARVEVFER